MIIFGWGKRTMKHYGFSERRNCTNCHNIRTWELRRYRTWITLFFIPVIPYKQMVVKVCPVCGSYAEVSKMELEQAIKKSKNVNASTHSESQNNDDGLTEVQRNFREQMKKNSNN